MRAVVLVVAAMVCGPLWGQDLTCNSGDIAWVSSAVDANVGLASGAGRCLANTVAGAAYNDATMPWGVQGVIDCGCAGLVVAISGDTGNYGSATASWNNRFDANKQIQVVTTSGALTAPITVVGYPNIGVATSCAVDNTPTGCPVEMNFTGGVTDGWNVTANNWTLLGLRLTGATDDCLVVSSDNIYVGGMELDGCLNTAIEQTGGNESEFSRNYIHDVGDANTDVAVRLIGSVKQLFNYNYIAGVEGPAVEYTGTGLTAEHNIIFNPGGDCVRIGGIAGMWRWNTLVDCGGDGFTLQPAAANSSRSYLLFNLITGASGWGIDSIGSAGTRPTGIIAYNVLGDNGLGDINPTREPVSITLGNVEGATVVYAGGSDFTPTSGAEITLFYPRGLTEVTINAGAVVEGGGALSAGGGGVGAGGIYIPGGPR